MYNPIDVCVVLFFREKNRYRDENRQLRDENKYLKIILSEKVLSINVCKFKNKFITITFEIGQF